FKPSRPLRPSAFQEGLQLPRPRRVAEFAERLGFDLADAFARDGEVLSDLFERVLAAVRAEAEAHLDDLLLARRQRLQDLLTDFAEVDVDDRSEERRVGKEGRGRGWADLVKKKQMRQ